MDGNVFGEVQLVDNILQAEDFVRLRSEVSDIELDWQKGVAVAMPYLFKW